MGSIFLLAEPSLSPGNRAEGRRSEWETRLFVEEPMLSTGLHFASESTEWAPRALSSDTAAETSYVRRLEGHDPRCHWPYHAPAGAGPRHPRRQHLRVLLDTEVRTCKHGV